MKIWTVGTLSGTVRHWHPRVAFKLGAAWAPCLRVPALGAVAGTRWAGLLPLPLTVPLPPTGASVGHPCPDSTGRAVQRHVETRPFL